jgi:hypothetical protein
MISIYKGGGVHYCYFVKGGGTFDYFHWEEGCRWAEKVGWLLLIIISFFPTLVLMIHVFTTKMADKKRWFTLFFGLDGYWYYVVSKIKKALISSVRPNDRYQNYVVDEVEKTLISAVSFSALFVWLNKKYNYFNVKVKNLKTLQPSKNTCLQHVHSMTST